jgi:molybdopterin-guanine dinucleotide biosynthesis protein A
LPSPANPIRDQVTAVVLAGGKARRMGGEDKGLVEIAGRPMVSFVIDAMRPQVSGVVLNANRNQARYGEFGCPVIADRDQDYRGPLAGIARGMEFAATRYVVVVPCDSPLVADDLVCRLHAALSAAGTPIAAAHDGDRLQPVFALLECSLCDDLNRYLAGGGRKIDRWYDACGYATADCSDAPDTFLNINTPADMRALEGRLATRIEASRQANESQ